MRRGVVAALCAMSVAAVVSAGAPSRSPADCGVASEFAGTVILSGLAPGTVELRWSVFEDVSVRGYRLSRYEAGCTPVRGCATRIARKRVEPGAAGVGALREHKLVDTAPPGTWIYRLEIRRTHGRKCTLETEPLVVPSPPPCDVVDVCSQVEAGLSGEVTPGGVVELTWMTHAESEAIEGYRLLRYDCARPARCQSEVVAIDATGRCGTVQVHGVTDTPPPGIWTYRVEVVGTRGGTACMAETTVRVER